MKLKRLPSGKLYMRGSKLVFAFPGVSDPSNPNPTPTDPTPLPEGGPLTVNPESMLHRPYQRIGTSKAIAISGTSTAPANTIIEARAINETTLAGVTPWTTLSTVGADGTYSGVLEVPQGKWYKRQVRVLDASEAITETGSFGIGIGIATNGQSNMVGLRDNGSEYPLGDIAAYEYANGVLRRVGNINDKVTPNTLFGSGGYSTYAYGGYKSDGHVFLANLVAQNTGLPVFIINMAVGGSTISQWMDNGTVNNWSKFVDALNRIGGDCEIGLWLQGESNNGTDPVSYRASLAALQQQYHTLTNRNASTFKFGVIGLGPVSISSSYSGGNNTNFGRMRASQAKFANETPGAFYVASAHDFGFAATGDGVHMGGITQSHLGRRYANSVSAVLGFGVSAAGPRIINATKTGNTINVTVMHSGGSALQDGMGSVYGPSLGGFQVFDNGVEIAITGSAITGKDTFSLTLATVPVGTCTLSYASQNAPHCVDTTDGRTEFKPESVLLDNAVYYKTRSDNPLGCPLQPVTAFPVN